MHLMFQDQMLIQDGLQFMKEVLVVHLLLKVQHLYHGLLLEQVHTMYIGTLTIHVKQQEAVIQLLCIMDQLFMDVLIQ